MALLGGVVIATSVHAIDVGGAMKKTGEKMVKGAATEGINKELGKKQYQCSWNNKTGNVEGCNLKNIAGFLAGQRTAVESSGTYSDYDINIHCQDYKCYDKVRDELKANGVGSWDINRKTDNVNNKEVKFTVAIQ